MTTKREHESTSGVPRRRNRQAPVWMAALLLVVIGGMAVWRALPSDPPLTERARRLTVLSSQKHEVYWRTTDSLLVLSTEHVDETLRQTPPWKGSVRLVSLSSGVSTPLPELTRSLNHEGGIPWELSPSPDGTRLLWLRRMSGDAWPFPAVATLDGQGLRTWDCERKLVPFWVDAKHCIEVSPVGEVWLHDVEAANGDHTYPIEAAQARTVLARRWIRQPFSVDVQSSYGDADLPCNKVRLNVFSTEEYDRQRSPRRILSTIVTLPAGCDIAETVLSPRQDFILYHARQAAINPLETWLHRIVPAYRPHPDERETLMISDEDYGEPAEGGAPEEHAVLVRALLEHGADPDSLNLAGERVLLRALYDQHYDTLRILLEHGASPNIANPSMQTPLMLAAEQGEVGIVRSLLDHGARLDAQCDHGGTALGWAVPGKHHGEIVRLLLERGASVNLRDRWGQTALFLCEDPAVTQLLLSHRAGINIQDAKGRTPLMEAVDSDRAAVVPVLLRSHARVDLEDEDRETALSLALQNKNRAIIRLLRQAGARIPSPLRKSATSAEKLP